MNVVKQAMLGHQEGVRLEGALWKLLVGVSEVSGAKSRRGYDFMSDHSLKESEQ